MRNILLVAGPAALQPQADQRPLLAGGGVIAAIAGAALNPIQLWSRVGTDYDGDRMALLERRGLDTAGADQEGPTARWTSTDGLQGTTSALPESLAPVSASEVGGALLVDLPEAELSRAFNTLDQLEGDPIDLRATALSQPGAASLELAATHSDVVFTPYRQAADALGITSPVALAQQLQQWGATSVCLSNGPFGGLIAYKAKVTTWQALPQANDQCGAALPAFAGLTVANLVSGKHTDFRSLKRSCAIASASVATCLKGPGTRALMQLTHAECMAAFNRQRRTAKT